MNPNAKYPSKERVERGDYLVYAEGDEIPETDVDELVRQGYLNPGAKSAAADAEAAPAPAADAAPAKPKRGTRSRTRKPADPGDS